MPEHFTKATVEASIFCKECMKETRWRIADGRRQWCIPCYERNHAPGLKAPREPKAEQLGLFAMMGETCEAPAAVPAAPALTPEWWLPDDVAERREGVLRSAGFWQATHDATGLPYATQESIYAGRLRQMAADMEERPEFYQRRPAHVSDFQWFFNLRGTRNGSAGDEAAGTAGAGMGAGVRDGVGAEVDGFQGAGAVA